MPSKVHLNFACGLYDRMQALQTGEVQPEGIDLNFITVNHPRDVFDRMVGGHEFDLSELSASEYITRYVAGDRSFVALPVFPSRTFRHGFIAVNDRTVQKPTDLNGKRIGVQKYTITAAVWQRGLLQQAGVDLSSITWVEGAMEKPGMHGKPSALPLLTPVKLETNQSDKSLSDLLANGQIDATIGADVPPSLNQAPHVKRLFPDFRAVEQQYYRETGIFPIMHLVAIRREVYEQHPFIATALYDAFCDSKTLALNRMKFTGALRYMLPWLPAELDEIQETFGDDPWPYGIEPNRKTLEALIHFLHDQSMIERIVTVDELFLQPMGTNWKVG